MPQREEQATQVPHSPNFQVHWTLEISMIFPMRHLKLIPPASLRPLTSAGTIILDALTDVILTVSESFVG